MWDRTVWSLFSGSVEALDRFCGCATAAQTSTCLRHAVHKSPVCVQSASLSDETTQAPETHVRRTGDLRIHSRWQDELVFNSQQRVRLKKKKKKSKTAGVTAREVTLEAIRARKKPRERAACDNPTVRGASKRCSSETVIDRRGRGRRTGAGTSAYVHPLSLTLRLCVYSLEAAAGFQLAVSQTATVWPRKGTFFSHCSVPSGHLTAARAVLRENVTAHLKRDSPKPLPINDRTMTVCFSVWLCRGFFNIHSKTPFLLGDLFLLWCAEN